MIAKIYAIWELQKKQHLREMPNAILICKQTHFYTAVMGGVFLKLNVFKRLENTLSE